MEDRITELRKQRSTAKSCLVKKASLIAKKAGGMSEQELREEFTKLNHYHNRFLDLSEDYKIELGVFQTSDDKQVALQEYLDKDSKELYAKFSEAEQIIQFNLWTKFCNLASIIQNAEMSCDEIEHVSTDTNPGYFKALLGILEKRIKEIVWARSIWEQWIPADQLQDFNRRIRKIKSTKQRMEFKAVRVIAPQIRTLTRGNLMQPPATQSGKMNATGLPIFNGGSRDFYRWKQDWESLQRQGNPSGSSEAVKAQLIESIDEKIIKDLSLRSYSTDKDIFRALESKYGNKSAINLDLLKKLQDLPPVEGNDPRQISELLTNIEKALIDLAENSLTIRTVESKLPKPIQEAWLVFKDDPENNVSTVNHFSKLLAFLKSPESILDRTEQWNIHYSEKPEDSDVCGKFEGLGLQEKRAPVTKSGACELCLRCHDGEEPCNNTYLCDNNVCMRDHHYLPSPIKEKDHEQKTDETGILLKHLSNFPLEDVEEIKKALMCLSKYSPADVDIIKKALKTKPRHEDTSRMGEHAATNVNTEDKPADCMAQGENPSSDIVQEVVEKQDHLEKDAHDMLTSQEAEERSSNDGQERHDQTSQDVEETINTENFSPEPQLGSDQSEKEKSDLEDEDNKAVEGV
uniref:uncharacterized protein LOC131141648 n=1 Tax=Doryrhamphus excisus TaxID=161450 RepID=UPI0025AEA947|nr:uncharacterized protein LOC131141648 [Doryrhamphus excisus]